MKKPLLTALVALMGTGMTIAAQADVLANPIYGTLLASDEWDMENEGPLYGLYRFDGTQWDVIAYDNYLAAMGGGTYVNGVFCYNYNFSFMGSMAMNLYLLYDVEKDELSGWQLFETSYSDVATQVAYDATSGQVYGQFYNRDRSARVWGTRDYKYGETQAIRSMISLDLCALAFDRLGRAWAVDTQGNLLKIDKLTGEHTVIGNTGLQLAATTQQSGAIDPNTGIFYMIAALSDNTSALYSIDLNTAGATLVAAMPGNEQVTGAYFLPKTYAATAPAAPAEMQLGFAADALSGTVTCVAPATTEEGKVLTEGALLTLTLDGEKVGEAQTTPGQTVAFDVTVAKMGTHIFQLTASNAAGEGRPATIHQWVGLDIPEAVIDLKCRNTDNTHALLTWTAPTSGVHGGYIDPAHLNYTVIDSDNNIVVTGLTATSCEVSKSGSRMTTRTYSVIAFTDTEAGMSATSNRVYFGNRYKVPYSTYFDTQTEFDLWYVIDANDDGSTWTYDSYNRYVHYNYDKYNPADDWLFSAPIRLQTQQYYDLTSNVASEMTYYRERFEIFVCNAQDPDSIVAVVRTPTETEKNNKEERAFYTYTDCFCVPADGDYYLAYHCISDANQLRFEVRNIELNIGSSYDAPAAADNAIFRPGSQGSYSANVEFDAPTKSIRGDELTTLTKAELYRGGYLCTTLNDIQPGQHYTITDGSAPHGYCDYTLFIYNENGKGLPVSGKVYVGVDTPAVPENVQIRLDGNNVVMSWDPVTIGQNGGYVDPDKIFYAVVRQQDIEVVYQGYDTQCIDNTLPNYGAQTNYNYGVFAYLGTTPGQGAPTKDVIMGTPYTMPFEETFADDSGKSQLWLIGYDPYNTIGTNWSIGEYPSYDGKPGNLTCSAIYEDGGYHYISSGKIKVNTTATQPVLTFPFQCTSMDDRIEVGIATQGVLDDDEIVATFTPSTTTDWNMACVNLSAYKGKNVIVTWHCYLAGEGDIVLDDIRLYDDPNMGVEDIDADSNYMNVPVYDLHGRRVEPGKTEGFQIMPSSKKLTLYRK